MAAEHIELWLKLADKNVSSAYCRQQTWWDKLVLEVDTLEKYRHCVQLLHITEDILVLLETFSRDIALQHPDIATDVMSVVRLKSLLIWEPAYFFLHPSLMSLYNKFKYTPTPSHPHKTMPGCWKCRDW